VTVKQGTRTDVIDFAPAGVRVDLDAGGAGEKSEDIKFGR
jgi:hypothetical protein